MNLLEREAYLDELNRRCVVLGSGQGHTVFLTGEAGIGKTSLITAFLRQLPPEVLVLSGACDSLLTPRPLGPLFDLAYQLDATFRDLLRSEKESSLLFSAFQAELMARKQPVVLIFEDVHWADGGTVDLIKFLSRRIRQIPCLFVLSYRDDEVLPAHPIRSVFSELPAQSYSKIQIKRLSLEAVRKLAQHTDYDPDEVYALTEGNPFYVNEILASYSSGIPENIKDSVLSVFHKQSAAVKALWELVSILPGRIDLALFRLLAPDIDLSAEGNEYAGVLRTEGRHLFFKHELYRKIIEESLTELRRIELNDRVLGLLLASPAEELDLAVLIHVAQHARNKEVISRYAPLAAQKAAVFGAHTEAAHLFEMAILYAVVRDQELAELYEKHAYECYLTNRIQKAIDSQQAALSIWQRLGQRIRVGSSFRILSRLNWFIGQKDLAEDFGLRAIQELENGFPLEERARAYSNYSQLKMLSSEREEAVKYGQKAIDLALKINNEEIRCHALNNIGSTLYETDPSDFHCLEESLQIALTHGFHEHAARAYTNLACYSIEHKNYLKARTMLEDGISYCRENDLDSWTYYMSSWKARLHFEIGEWDTAINMATHIAESPNHPAVVRIGSLIILGRLLVRQGEAEKSLQYLDEASKLALSTKELQRIVPVAVALLEFAWLSGKHEVFNESLNVALEILRHNSTRLYDTELAFWMHQVGRKHTARESIAEAESLYLSGKFDEAARLWKSRGCPYEQALALAAGNSDAQREAFSVLEDLKAFGTIARLKADLRARGIKQIPRGHRESTRSNQAHLTKRQIEVLKLLREGFQNSEIADRLFISAKTVDHHVSAILFKLDVNTRNKAVIAAEKLGIL